MKEDVLHYIWKNGLFNKSHIKTIEGDNIQIIHPGIHNHDSGPDFFQSKLQIGSILFVGNVELHIEGNDWYKHNHHLDSAYQNVILHVVFHKPTSISMNQNQIPTLVLEPLIDTKFLNNYSKLTQQNIPIPCYSSLQNCPTEITQQQWLDAGEKRLIHKSKRLQEFFKLSENRVDQAFFILLCRNFGFGINNEVSQMLGLRLPIQLVYKYMHSLFQLEALILGMSGLLENDNEDDYFTELEKEFRYLKSQHKLQPLPKHIWKFSKTRPGNFPTIRLAQLAALLHKKVRLIPEIFEANSLKDLEQIFQSDISPYWQNHYAPGKKHRLKQLQISKEGIHNIIVNSVLPLWVWEAIQSQRHILMQKAISILKEIPPENNKISRLFEMKGIEMTTAFQSQASQYQLKELCHKKQCLNCKIGQTLLE